MLEQFARPRSLARIHLEAPTKERVGACEFLDWEFGGQTSLERLFRRAECVSTCGGIEENQRGVREREGRYLLPVRPHLRNRSIAAA